MGDSSRVDPAGGVQVLGFGPTGLGKSAWGQRPRFQRHQCILRRKGNADQHCGTLSAFMFLRSIKFVDRRRHIFCSSVTAHFISRRTQLAGPRDRTRSEDSRAAEGRGCESRHWQSGVGLVCSQVWPANCRTEVQFTTVAKRKLKVHDELPSLEKHDGHIGEMPSVWGGFRCQR